MRQIIKLLFEGKGETLRPFVIEIKHSLENSRSLSYESFFVDIIRTLAMILLYTPDFVTFLRCCPNQDCTPINNFLLQNAKKGNNQILKEWSYFTLSAMYRAIVDSPEPEVHQKYVSPAHSMV